MASLNTLRTKFGYVLSGVIALALLAFIFSMKSEMGFSGNDPVVGEINSEKVLYTEYLSKYEQVKMQSGITESTEQEAASLASGTWQALIADKLIMPGLDELGLSMSEAERMAVISGDVATQSFYSAFADAATGIYNPANVSDFLSQAEYNPQASQAWAMLNEQARQERAVTKYNALVMGGAYVNKLEVAEGVKAANNTFKGEWVSKPYSSMPDSLFTVSASEIKAYYNARKESYKRTPSRALSYVTFEFDATEQDIIDIENKALATSREFAVVDDFKAYTRANLDATISENYLSSAQLSDEEKAALEKGEMYGPINKNNVWTMSRVASTISAPDTLGVRHIVLRYDQAQLADSLQTLLKGGADFAELARNNSLYAQTAQNGGEVGVMPFSSFTGEFVTALAPAKKGQVVRVETGDMIQLIEVYRADRPSTHYQVATVEYPVEASVATVSALHSDAGLFSMEAKGSLEAFTAAANAKTLAPKATTIANGERTVRGIADSREIARWAFGAEVGEISDIFKTDAGYIVAILTSIDDSEYRTLESVTPAIRTALLRDKKFEAIAAELEGSSLEAIAKAADVEVKEFENVKFSSYYIPSLGVEPKVIGAITSSPEGELSAPIKGNTGAYVVVVSEVAATEDQTTEAERARTQAQVEERAMQYAFNAIQQMGNIKDLRGKFF